MKTNKIVQAVEKQACEDATGCRESCHNATLYAEGGSNVSDEEASSLFRNGKTIHDPNAGAGSFRQVLARLGYVRVEVLDWTSSAGDWAFKVKAGVIYQENRYPNCGFKYSLSFA